MSPRLQGEMGINQVKRPFQAKEKAGNSLVYGTTKSIIRAEDRVKGCPRGEAGEVGVDLTNQVKKFETDPGKLLKFKQVSDAVRML